MTALKPDYLNGGGLVDAAHPVDRDLFYQRVFCDDLVEVASL
jgi:hypothetical protein